MNLNSFIRVRIRKNYFYFRVGSPDLHVFKVVQRNNASFNNQTVSYFSRLLTHISDGILSGCAFQMPWIAEEADDFEQAWLLLADVYITAGKYDMATELLKKCLEHNKVENMQFSKRKLIYKKRIYKSYLLMEDVIELPFTAVFKR